MWNKSSFNYVKIYLNKMIFNDQVHNQYISFSFTSPSSILVTSQADKITSNKIESGLHQVYPLKTLHVKKKRSHLLQIKVLYAISFISLTKLNWKEKYPTAMVYQEFFWFHYDNETFNCIKCMLKMTIEQICLYYPLISFLSTKLSKDLLIFFLCSFILLSMSDRLANTFYLNKMILTLDFAYIYLDSQSPLK